MKNIKLASALAIAMGLSAFGTANAADDSGTITFHGVVTSSTCTVRGGAGTDGGDHNFSVTLDGVPATSLAAQGSTAAQKSFNVDIGGPGESDCGATAGTVASMSFITSPQVDTNGNLNNLLTDDGTDAQIQLLNNDGTVINLATANAGLQEATIVGNQAQLTYSAQYFAKNAGTTPGKIETNAVYQVSYN
jgi:major type 1 subunit fimbrin (pilin)